MLPTKLQNDLDVQKTYEARIIISVEDDMKDYSTMLFLIRYWVGLKDIFKTGGVKTMFHTIAKKLMKKDILGILRNENLPDLSGFFQIRAQSGPNMVEISFLSFRNIYCYNDFIPFNCFI